MRMSAVVVLAGSAAQAQCESCHAEPMRQWAHVSAERTQEPEGGDQRSRRSRRRRMLRARV